jgi:hypothetical protein
MRRAGSGREVLKNRVREKVPWDLYFWCIVAEKACWD